jgi:ribosome biogenesis GTPase
LIGEKMIARIIRIISKEYTLMDDKGNRYDAILTGKIRMQVKPAAGDLVEAVRLDNRWVVEKILPRRNKLIRPSVANIDQALIVMSVKSPDFSPALIDRLSVLIMSSGIQPMLVVTKCDLGIEPDFEERIEEYERGPMQVIRTGKGSLDPSLAGILDGKISVLTGQTGAGKSTLLNELEPSFHLATQETSKALGRGKHTTRHNELHPVAGGLVADTPGFSSLDFSHIGAQELASYVPDFLPYLGQCRFNDCIHQNEPGCAVKDAVERGDIPRVRYEDYLQIMQMIQERKERYL